MNANQSISWFMTRHLIYIYTQFTKKIVTYQGTPMIIKFSLSNSLAN